MTPDPSASDDWILMLTWDSSNPGKYLLPGQFSSSCFNRKLGGGRVLRDSTEVKATVVEIASTEF